MESVNGPLPYVYRVFFNLIRQYFTVFDGITWIGITIVIRRMVYGKIRGKRVFLSVCDEDYNSSETVLKW